MKKHFLFFIFIFFVFSICAYAEDTCTGDMKNQLSADALKVSASYEFASTEEGTPYFKISIYNITENIYVAYDQDIDADSFDDTTMYVLYSDTTDGVYTFDDFNIDTIFKYSFEVWAGADTGCSYKILATKLTKPKKNYFSDLEQCQYEKMKDYYYCKEWITNDFYIDDDQVLENIDEKLNATSTTSKIIKDDDSVDYITFQEIYINIRIYLIIGLVIGIIIDVWCIYMSIRKVRDSTL